MQIFVYECITGGGLYHRPHGCPPSGSLLDEGRAMLNAVCCDLAEIPQVEVHILWDRRLPSALRPGVNWIDVGSAGQEQRSFDRLAVDCDRTLIIAPESDGWLLSRCQQAVRLGATLIGPLPELVALATDKCATADWLRRVGLPVPATYRCRTVRDLPPELNWPAIVKPVDGAGSLEVRRIGLAEAQQLLNGSRTYCVQAFCPGRAASVAALCGPRQQIPLPPCWQHLEPSSFAYRGGSLIYDATLARRARRLAQRTLRSLPAPLGYLGLDLILGPAGDGSMDCLIEVNPRLTTSYVGLSVAANQSLAAALLQVVAGKTVELSFCEEPLEFESSGHVYRGKKAERKESG